MPTKYLLTGVTGGLGASILSHLLHTHPIPPQDIVATSRSPSHRASLEALGVQFRIADNNVPSTLEAAFRNIETLLFMSSSNVDTPAREKKHVNVVAAAKKAGIEHV